MTPARVWAFLWLSLTYPRTAARRVLAQVLSLADALALLLLAECVGMLLAVGLAHLLPGPRQPLAAFLIAQPLLGAALQAALVLALAACATAIGRWAGGTGTLAGAVALFAWVQAVLVALQAVQTVLLLAVPTLAVIAALAGFVWFVWAIAAAVAELHGFPSTLKTLAGVFISFLAILFLSGIVLTAMGIDLPGAR